MSNEIKILTEILSQNEHPLPYLVEVLADAVAGKKELERELAPHKDALKAAGADLPAWKALEELIRDRIVSLRTKYEQDVYEALRDGKPVPEWEEVPGVSFKRLKRWKVSDLDELERQGLTERHPIVGAVDEMVAAGTPPAGVEIVEELSLVFRPTKSAS